MSESRKATSPEDITRVFVEAARAADPAGMASVYADDAVMAFPPGRQTVGRAAITAVFEQLLAASDGQKMEPEDPLPTLICGDIALTSTQSKDGMGTRVQVARRQADGSWLRILDRPEVV